MFTSLPQDGYCTDGMYFGIGIRKRMMADLQSKANKYNKGGETVSYKLLIFTCSGGCAIGGAASKACIRIWDENPNDVKNRAYLDSRSQKGKKVPFKEFRERNLQNYPKRS